MVRGLLQIAKEALGSSCLEIYSPWCGTYYLKQVIVPSCYQALGQSLLTVSAEMFLGAAWMCYVLCLFLLSGVEDLDVDDSPHDPQWECLPDRTLGERGCLASLNVVPWKGEITLASRSLRCPAAGRSAVLCISLGFAKKETVHRWEKVICVCVEHYGEMDCLHSCPRPPRTCWGRYTSPLALHTCSTRCSAHLHHLCSALTGPSPVSLWLRASAQHGTH